MRVTNIYESFTHKMAAKTSWHRDGTKLRQCHPMYTGSRPNGNDHSATTLCLHVVVCGTTHSACGLSGDIVSRFHNHIAIWWAPQHGTQLSSFLSTHRARSKVCAAVCQMRCRLWLDGMWYRNLRRRCWTCSCLDSKTCLPTESLGNTGEPIKQEFDVCRRVGY